MKISSVAIKEVEIRARATGMEQTTQKVDQLAKSTDGLVVTSDKLTKHQLSAERALERTRRQIDMNYRQQRSFEQAQRTLDRAFNQGLITTAAYERNLGLAAVKFGQIAAANDNAAVATSRFARAGQELSNSFLPVAGVLGGVARVLGPIGIGIAAALAASNSIASAGDAWTRYGNQLVAAGVSSTSLAATQRDLAELAIGTRSNLDATVALYARMTRASAELGVSESEVRRVTEILGKEIATAGLSAGEAAGGLLQFSQGLQAGRFNGDELRSVLENLPGVARAIAKEFNTTVGGLREMGAAGELSSERVFRAVLRAGKGVDEAFGKSIPTAAQAMENLGTASTRLFAEVDRRLGISQSRAQAIVELGQLMTWMAEKLEGAGKVAAGGDTALLNQAIALAKQDIRFFDARGMTQDAEEARRRLADLEQQLRAIEGAGAAAAIGARQAAEGFNDVAKLANVASSAVANFGVALRSIQMGIPEVAKVLTAQKEMAELRVQNAQAVENSTRAMNAESLDRNDAAAAAGRHAERMRDLTKATEERSRVITGATELEKTFGTTLRTTVVAGLEGVAKGNAQARDSYAARNELIEQAVRLGMSEAEATTLRAQSEKILAQELKNVAAAEAKKGSTSKGSSSAADGFDNAVQRLRDQTEELRLQEQQASKTGIELYRLEAVNRLRRAAIQAGRQDEKGLTDQIEATANAYAEQRKSTELAIEAQRRMQESTRDLANTVSGLIEDLITGQGGLDGALKSIGRSYLKNSLDALISGSGPLAQLTGMAPTEKGGIGGIFNSDFFSKMSKAVSGGTSTGFTSLFGGDPLQGPLITGKTLDTLSTGLGNMTGVLQGLGGLAGAYGIGASTGSPIAGCAGGGMSGGGAGSNDNDERIAA